MCKFLHIQYESQKAIKAALPEAKKIEIKHAIKMAKCLKQIVKAACSNLKCTKA